MLALVFNVGDEQLALDHRHVVEVVPAIPLQPMPHARAYLPGLLSYRGDSVPVVDLCQVALGRSVRRHLSTRIVIVHTGDGGLIGLLAEHVVECRNSKTVPAPSAKTTTDEAPTWRTVEVDDLLPAELRELLWRPEVETRDCER